MAKQQKVLISIPTGYTPVEREAIALEIVDFIRERSRKGKDKNNNRFTKYSKAYSESLDFKIAGKSAKVDLTLSGDMLAALDVLKTSNRGLTIGYQSGDEINGRVEGNRLGSYGGKPNAQKARDFLGISTQDLSKILRKYPPNSDRSLERAEQILETNQRASEAGDGIE